MTFQLLLLFTVLLLTLWTCRLWIGDRIIHRYAPRTPHKVIGRGPENTAYLVRWAVTPWNALPYQNIAPQKRTRWQRFAVWIQPRLPKLWLHQFLRDDADSYHDHPWWYGSLIIRGQYFEEYLTWKGGHPVDMTSERVREPGDILFARARHAHKIRLPMTRRLEAGGRFAPVPCWTLFLTGGDARKWGFWCNKRGEWTWVERDLHEHFLQKTGDGCSAAGDL